MRLACYNNVTVQECDALGRTLRVQRCHNTMVQGGRNAFRDLLQGIGTAPNYIAAGISSSPAPADTDTALNYEFYRNACHSRLVMDNKAIFMATIDFAAITAAGDVNMKELGLFTGCGWLGELPWEGGVLWCRVAISPIDLGDTDRLNTIFVAWEIPLYAE